MLGFALTQKRCYRIELGNGLVGNGLSALLVSSYAYKIFDVVIGCKQLAHLPRFLNLLLRYHHRHHAAKALQHVDRRVMAAAGELAAQNDMAVENRSRGVGYWIVVVVALDQHRVNGGYRAVLALARALHKAR